MERPFRSMGSAVKQQGIVERQTKVCGYCFRAGSSAANVQAETGYGSTKKQAETDDTVQTREAQGYGPGSGVGA
jgi:hypothetical protein